MKLGNDGQGSGGYTGPKVKTPLEYDNKGGPKVSSPLDYDCKKPGSIVSSHPIDKTCKVEAQRRGVKSQALTKNQGRPGPLAKGSTDNGDQ